MPYTQIMPDGSTSLSHSGGISRFSLWTPQTAINLYSAGGDVAPLMGGQTGNVRQNANGFFPDTLIAAAANGDIRFDDPTSGNVTVPTLELMPSPEGQLAVLVALRVQDQTRHEVAALHGLSLRRVDTVLRQALDYCAAHTGHEVRAGARGPRRMLPQACLFKAERQGNNAVI